MLSRLPLIIMGFMVLGLVGGFAALWFSVPPKSTFSEAQAIITLDSQRSVAEDRPAVDEELPAPAATELKPNQAIAPASPSSPTFAGQAPPRAINNVAAPSFAGGATLPPANIAEQTGAAEAMINPTTSNLPNIASVEAETQLSGFTSKSALKPAPIDELVESTALGPLPIISAGGDLYAWSSYARPFRDTTLRPRVSLLMVNLGIHTQNTTTALQQLPSEISVAFPPYVRNIEYWAQQSRQVGHEVFIQVPMEPFDYPTNDPGPKTLLTTLKQQENQNHLEWVMTRFPGYVGLVNLMGGRYTSSERHISQTLMVLKRHGVAFVEQNPAEFSRVANIAAKVIIPFKRGDLMIDSDPGKKAIRAKLDELERIAQKGRAALGIIHPYPSTMSVVQEWSETLAERKIALAPVSAILAQGGAR